MTRARYRARPLTFLSVVGARPQFIKAAVVSRALLGLPEKKRPRHRLIHTGQHFEPSMSTVFFCDLALPKPVYNLGVGGLTPAAQLGRIVEQLASIYKRERPQAVIVYGDTTSTLGAALAASLMQVPLAHVEAGLRSFNRQMPEETNRILTDHLARWLFCPSLSAAKNLASEGIKRGVYVVGDVMVDAFLQAQPLLLKQQPAVLEKWNAIAHGYYLVTLHRAENTIDAHAVIALLDALAGLEIPSLLPLHPRTRNLLKRAGWQFQRRTKLRIIPPVPYHEMLALERGARAILTDSGGVQKEAYFLGVPCLTLRRETEWVETVEAGWNQLVGLEPKTLLNALGALNGIGRASRRALYGTGRAGIAVVSQLLKDMR